MSKSQYILYDSNNSFSNEIIEELKKNNLLSTFTLIDKKIANINKLHETIKECILRFTDLNPRPGADPINKI